MKKWWLAVLSAVLVIAMLLSGCAAGSSTGMDESKGGEVAGAPAYDEGKTYEAAASAEAGYDQAAEEAAEPQSGGAGDTADFEKSLLEPGVNRKIVYYGEISTQTENYSKDYGAILSKLSEMKGYVQNLSVSGTEPEEWQDTGRTAQMTLRVPSNKFDEFMGFLGGLGETINTSVNGDDISLQYFDTETRLKTLRTREGRLQALLEKAATMEDIIELEQALADVSYEIQSLEMNLRDYDSLIDYSTVTITLQEVQVISEVKPSSPKTLGERISSGFYSVLNVLADIGEGLLVFLIGGIPVWIVLAIIIVPTIILVKRSKKKRAKEAAQKAEERAKAAQASGVWYDPRTGFAYYNGTAPDAAPKEEKQNDSKKDGE